MAEEQGKEPISDVAAWQLEQGRIADQFNNAYTQLRQRQKLYNEQSDNIFRSSLVPLIAGNLLTIEQSLIAAPSSWLAITYNLSAPKNLEEYCAVQPSETRGIYVISTAKISDVRVRNDGAIFKDFYLSLIIGQQILRDKAGRVLIETVSGKEFGLPISDIDCEILTDQALSYLIESN